MRIGSPNGRIGVKIKLGPRPEHPQECGDCTPTGLAMVDAPPQGREPGSGLQMATVGGPRPQVSPAQRPRAPRWPHPPRATPRPEPATAWGLLLDCPGGFLLRRGRPFRLQGSTPRAPRARSLQSTPQGQAARPAWGPPPRPASWPGLLAALPASSHPGLATEEAPRGLLGDSGAQGSWASGRDVPGD